eukprot:1160533-Pelagomonas_calceolata.AAC.13
MRVKVWMWDVESIENACVQLGLYVSAQNQGVWKAAVNSSDNMPPGKAMFEEGEVVGAPF